MSDISITDSINDKPSVIKFTGQYFKNTNNEYEKLFVHQFYKNGKLHRDKAPAKVYTNGNEVWYKDGLIHRDNAPAIINHIPLDFIDNIDLLDEVQLPLKCSYNVWYNKGVFHRLTGPAVESIHIFKKQDQTTEKLVHKEYFINGIEYTEKEFINIMKKVNLLLHNMKRKHYSKQISFLPIPEDLKLYIIDFLTYSE
jgi:hypothetical protein